MGSHRTDQTRNAMRRKYVIIRRSDDTGQEAVIDCAPITSRRAAARLACDLTRTATHYGAAVSYRVAESLQPAQKGSRS